MNKLFIFGAVFVAILLAVTWMAAGSAMGDDVVNILAMLGAVATAVIAIFVALKYIRQMQTDKASGQLADENWDGIGEYKNELPMGWAVIFLGTTIWAIWYMLMGYPVNSFSQIGQYNEEVADHDAKFSEKFANLSAEEQVEMGGSIFIVQCAPCHGLTADGIDGKAADLHNRISKESVVYTIKNGGNNLKSDYPGGMPGMMLSDDAQIDAVADYVAAGFPEGHAGAEYFVSGGCTGCHGEKGEGMAYVGPTLSKFTTETIASVLKDGKKGNIGAMPAFTNMNDVQKDAVAAYVTSLK